jgi:indolepyruvate ferredoxin oxidoreductase
LVAYQNERYARRYVDFVEMVRRVESERVPGSTAMSEAVARNLYKLMAYKDEYEVARLSVGADLDAAITAQFGAGSKVEYRLHPPTLRALGLRSKISLGSWFRPVMRLLVAMRGLRGTVLDPFGHTALRRLERELISEYRSTVQDLLPRLNNGTIPLAVDIANLPDEIRGYEAVKLRNVAGYRDKLAALCESMTQDPHRVSMT